MSDTSDLNLERLLTDAASGDERAWRQIIEVYTPRVFGLLRTHCDNTDIAEEITQSTFCTVAEKLADYTEQGRFESWLFRIAMNRLRDEMRRRKRHAVSVEEETLTALAGSEPSRVDEPEQQQHLREALTECLSRLSDADRQVIHLRHIGGLSFRQIAEVLDEPVGTVLARQHRALKKLRDLLEPHFDEDV